MASRLAAYVELLARWNRRINLTGFDLDAISDPILDRLVVEGVAAARKIGLSNRIHMDIGSGGGSPALPIQIASPAAQLHLIEVRQRKAAFLREAVRHLGLAGVTVHAARWEDVVAQFPNALDMVSLRAIRLDRELLAAIESMVRPAGHIAWFGGDAAALAGGYHVETIPVAGSLLVLARRERDGTSPA